MGRKKKVYGVWFQQENQVAYAVNASDPESAIRKATRIWKSEHSEPTFEAIEALPPWGFADPPKEA